VWEENSTFWMKNINKGEGLKLRTKGVKIDGTIFHWGHNFNHHSLDSQALGFLIISKPMKPMGGSCWQNALTLQHTAHGEGSTLLYPSWRSPGSPRPPLPLLTKYSKNYSILMAPSWSTILRTNPPTILFIINKTHCWAVQGQPHYKGKSTPGMPSWRSIHLMQEQSIWLI
jgi:hypothetical protein